MSGVMDAQEDVNTSQRPDDTDAQADVDTDSPATMWRRKKARRLELLYATAMEDSSEPEAKEVAHLSEAIAGMTLLEQEHSADVLAEAAEEPEAFAERPSPVVTENVGSANPKDTEGLLDSRSLQHMRSAFLQYMLSTTVSGRPLTFSCTPSPSQEYVRYTLEDVEYNSGPCALDHRKPENRPFLSYHSWLITSAYTLSRVDVNPELTEERDKLRDQIHEEIDRLENIKELEWESQQRGPEQRPTKAGSVDTSRFFAFQSASWDLWSAPVYAISILAAAFHLVFGLPRRGTRALLAGLYCVVELTLRYARSGELTTQDRLLLRFISRDPRTVISAFDLDPSVDAFICCPTCFCLYPDPSTTPRLCTYRSTATSNACNAKLWRSRVVSGKAAPFPVRKYLHQSMKHWLGRMLSRPDIEEWLETPHPDLPSGSMKDIFDGMVLRRFLGPDGLRFLDAPLGELRLVFSLSADGFNPYQMKEAKHSVTSTAMYMVCLSLPPHLRYLPENMYLAGVIPGPTKPSTEQINHFLAILVDELLQFWNPGVSYSRTAKVPYGRLVRAALIPLVCDLPAARQMAGLGAHNHSQVLCSCCHIKPEDIENTDRSAFGLRSTKAHRAAASAWLNAQSSLDREQMFRSNGIRYSELLRLPYWNPVAYVVVDSMHDLYLGILQRHIRDFWAISTDNPDGDASSNDTTKAPPRPSGEMMEFGLDQLLHGTERDLRECGKGVLYHLCSDRGIRRAGTVSILLKNLGRWRQKEGLPKPRPAGSTPLAFPESSSRTMRRTRARVVSKEELDTAELLLSTTASCNSFAKKTNVDVLIAMCASRKLDTGGKKVLLAQRLWARDRGAEHTNVSETVGQTATARGSIPDLIVTTPPPVAQDAPQADDAQMAGAGVEEDGRQDSDGDEQPLPGTAALGRETMREYVNDRQRIELPRWVNPAPVAFGTSKHGKLSADQWRTVAIIHLPITLIRTWGTESGRRLDMLKNFLHVVDAIETLGLLEIDEERIAHAHAQLVKYLEGVKELYKGAKLQPTHHLALHLELFLRFFGPVHSWRSFAFERINFLLQSINSNSKFGELEMTMMMTSCRSANLRPLLNAPVVRLAMPIFVHELERLSTEERRGMRLDEVKRLVPDLLPRQEQKKAKEVRLDAATLSGLAYRLNHEAPAPALAAEGNSARPRLTNLSPKAQVVPKLDVRGVFYKPWKTALGDSNVIFHHPYTSSQSAGRIEQIFLYRRRSSDGTTLEETFLAVKQLMELDEADAVHDPYRRFGRVGGRLCSAEYRPEVLILRPEDVTCHFAKTTMEDMNLCRSSPGEGMKKLQQTYIHVRPLDRLLKTMDVSGMAANEEAMGE